jgi:hypothetical protein
MASRPTRRSSFARPRSAASGSASFLEQSRARSAPQVEFENRHSPQGQSPRRKAMPGGGFGVGTTTAASPSGTPRGSLRRTSRSTRQTLRGRLPQCTAITALSMPHPVRFAGFAAAGSGRSVWA